MEFEQYMTEGVRKAGNRSITFSNDVELYVGHEFDIEMTRCVSKLEMPVHVIPFFNQQVIWNQKLNWRKTKTLLSWQYMRLI
jgi:hypothetical protein